MASVRKFFLGDKILTGRQKLNAFASRRRPLSGAESVKWEDAKPYESIPGPKALPIFNVGNFWRFGPYWNLEPEKLLIKMRKEYGNIFRMTGIGQKDLVFLSELADVEKMFRHELKAPRRDTVECIRYYQEKLRPDIFSATSGLGTLQGEKWISTRKALNPIMMKPNSATPYLSRMETVADEFVERMKIIRDDRMELPDCYADELAKWSLESLAFVFLGERLCFLSDEKSVEASRMITAIRLSFESSFLLDLMPSFWKCVSTPTWRHFVKNMDVITDFVYENTSRKHVEIGKRGENKDGKSDSLLEEMIRSEKLESSLATGTDLIIGGVDVVSNAVGTVLVFLANHPEKQLKLFEEVKHFLPKKNSPLTVSVVAEMKYMKATLKESLRLRPVAPGNSRTTSTDLVLSGYRIPKGTKLLTLGSLISIDEKHFSEPSRFVPERWLKSDKSGSPASNSFANVPFGFGPRMCIGRRFAELQMQTLVTKIIRNFEVTYHYGDMDWRLLLLLRPSKPLKFRIADRPN